MREFLRTSIPLTATRVRVLTEPDGNPAASATAVRPGLVAGILLSLIVSAGGFLRLHDLGARPLRQGEIFVPGIALPAGVSSPEPMLTPSSTISVLMKDIHPPPWYLGMLLWTRLLGTSLFAIRLPSALFGIVAIVLIYVVAALESDRKTAVMSAALLAFNGHHLLYSQIARPYSMMCFVGLCSTAFLVLAQRPGRRQALWGVSYAVAILAGLSLHHYFWPFFLAQILWVLFNSLREGKLMDGVLRLQSLVFILAAPLAAIAVFQSRHPYLGSYLYQNSLEFFSDFGRFAFLFEPDGDPVRPFPESVNAALYVASAGLILLGIIAAARERKVRGHPIDLRGPSLWILGIATAFSSLAIVAIAMILRARGIGVMPLGTAAIPVVPLAMAVSAKRVWRFLGDRSVTDPAGGRRGGWPLVSWLAVVPAVLLFVVSATVRPFLAWKGMLIYSPYILIVLAAGIASVWRAPRFGRTLGLVMASALAIGLAVSVRQAYKAKNPQDYEGMATMWLAEIRDHDVVLSAKNWETTPVFFYLDLTRYQFVGRDFAARLERVRPSRVWVLLSEGEPIPEEISRSLGTFIRTRVLSAPRLEVQLYERAGPY